MSTPWESGAIEIGGETITVQAFGGMVLLTRQVGDDAHNITECRWTPHAAIGAANKHVAIAEALLNAANRVQQAIDAAALQREAQS